MLSCDAREDLPPACDASQRSAPLMAGCSLLSGSGQHLAVGLVWCTTLSTSLLATERLNLARREQL